MERHVAHKLEVERPDPAMLGDGQRPQGSVEGTPRPRHLALVHEELAVVQPNPRHLSKEIMRGKKELKFWNLFYSVSLSSSKKKVIGIKGISSLLQP